MQELQVLYDRKIDFIIQDNIKNFEQIPIWMNNYSADNGTWSDVDYTAGCSARRANWPAQQHFARILTLASQYKSNNDTQYLPIISKAMDYWFSHNYQPDTCLDQGGLTNSTCPCGTPGFWNTNWFGQMILLPRLVSNTCLLLKPNLSATQLSNCTQVIQRVYDRIDSYVIGIGPMTGANMLDAATAVLNLGILTDNQTTVSQALDRYYSQTQVIPETGADGIKQDGSYLQHGAQLYNGNYGKDFINSVVVLYSQTANTTFAPPLSSQQAFQTLLEGTEWMIVANTTNSSLLWEYSAIGRMVSFKASDKQASGGVAINMTRVIQATSSWANASAIHEVVQRLTGLQNQTYSGQGRLMGTCAFPASDYLVHRNASYVTTLKMFSRRTSNSECNNNQNPFGFHLSDGAIYNYIDGDEYIDSFAAWDWNLVPGTTVDYGATPLECNFTQYYGNTTFVGSLSANAGGVAVMHYLNPMTGTLSWEKTFYFFRGFYVVQINSIQQSSGASVITTLDQSNLKGDVYVNGQLLSTDSFANQDEQWHVWHNRVLYSIVNQTTPSRHLLKVNTAAHAVNDWATIGISQGQATQRLFTATVEHNSLQGLTYVVQLNTDKKQDQDIQSIVRLAEQNDDLQGRVRSAYHVKENILALAFWTKGSFSSPWHDGWTIQANQPILIWLAPEDKGFLLTVADPTQLLKTVRITIASQEFNIELPQNKYAGNSISISLS
ncbi:polysaccharide lyase family 8 protein [Choanephora cucurbitarum]|nr:polysaccharide lyase family 8 protein [Choanephora cucurbitarum]